MKITLLFQGDSITDCGRATCGGAGYDSKGLGPGYPALVMARLMHDRPDIEWNAINRGISGNRMVDLYARWRADCINLEPDVLSLLVGVNDSIHESWGNGVDIARSERFYREMLEWVKRDLPSVRLVIMEPFTLLPPDGGNNDAMAAEVVERGRMTKRLAGEFGASFIPLQTLFDDACGRAPREHWCADGFHPTIAGHQLIADAWLAAVEFR